MEGSSPEDLGMKPGYISIHDACDDGSWVLDLLMA